MSDLHYFVPDSITKDGHYPIQKEDFIISAERIKKIKESNTVTLSHIWNLGQRKPDIELGSDCEYSDE